MNKEKDWNEIWKNYKVSNKKKLLKIFNTFNFFKLDKHLSIFDIGCGDGQALSILKEKGFYNLKGIEPQEELFENNKDVFIEAGNCLDLSNISSKFDIVVIIGMLHHLKNFEEMKACINNISGVLKRGGKFYSLEPIKTFVRTMGTKILLESPIKNLTKYLKVESQLWLNEKKEFKIWFENDEKLTEYLQNNGFKIFWKKRDFKYRYLIFEKLR